VSALGRTRRDGFNECGGRYPSRAEDLRAIENACASPAAICRSTLSVQPLAAYARSLFLADMDSHDRQECLDELADLAG